MRIVILENSGELYTSQVYLVLGDASRIEDVNTLVDVGQDPAILASIERAPTGIGKWPVEQVVLTHGHSDHCALLPRVREAFHPRVFAFSPNIEGVDGLLRDGDTIKMGDGYFEVIYTPGHTPADITYKVEDAAFVGDTLLMPDYGTARADFPGGDAHQLYRSIRKLLAFRPRPGCSCATTTRRRAATLTRGRPRYRKNARRMCT